MAKLSLLFTLSICFLILFHVQGRQQGQSQCRLHNIDALEPTRTIQSEAGVTEHWDENNEQLDCAGVAVTRHTIQPKGLLLPHFQNAPRLTYIIQGRGLRGASLPGCPSTYQSSQQSQYGQGQTQSQQQHGDQHQRIWHIRAGDIIATPVGVAAWFYSEGETPLVMVTLLDTSNNENQLNRNPRTFYLGGNPQQREQESSTQHESSSNNILSSFKNRMLTEAFDVSMETARKLRGENDNRGSIVRVEKGLQVLRPSRIREEEEEKQQQMMENGVEESFCYASLRTNIDNPSKADVYNPRAGRINRVNSNKLRILNYLRLNAERGVLYKNAIMAPHWNLNAHSVIYVTRGNARVQVVGNYEQPIYDGELHQGQLLVVPQNFAVVKRAGDQGFDWISFKTNDKAMINTIAGRNSALRAMPAEILMNAFGISEEEVMRLKYNREEIEIFSPLSQPQEMGLA